MPSQMGPTVGRARTLEGVGSLACSVHDVLVGVAVEGGSATQQDVENHSNAPHVTLLGIAAHEHLGRDVVRSPQSLFELFFGGKEEGGAEVDEFDVDFAVFLDGVDQDVFGLEVAMDDTFGMAVGDGGQDLSDDVCGFELGHVLAFGDLIEEFAAVDVSTCGV